MDIDPAVWEPRGREPFYWSSAGCGAYVTGATTQPRPCHEPPVWAGVVYYQRPRPTLCWSFTCGHHVQFLHAPRRLLDRDHAEIARRREQHELALAGRPHTRTEPLATGLAAKRRLLRALAAAQAVDRSVSKKGRAGLSDI